MGYVVKDQGLETRLSSSLRGDGATPTRADGLRLRPDLGLTFDDVLLVPRFSSIKSRRDTSTATAFSRRVQLQIPIVSSNMDTVTESEMAIAMARHGGIGVIHRFMPAHQQATEVRRLKRAEALVVEHPMTIAPDATLGRARHEMEEHGIGGLVVVDRDGYVQGIVTRRDVMFATEDDAPVSAVMTPKDKLITAPKGTRFEEARSIIDANRVEKLPLVDEEGRLAGLITAKDIEQLQHYPQATKDPKGRLRVAAAVGVRPGYMQRAEMLLEAGADGLVIDIAHGDSTNAVDAASELRSNFGDGWELVIGNVATGNGALRLVDAGADAIKVGVGPGSICITRLVTGFGVPQLSAIAECAHALEPHGIPLIADGGIRNSGDVVKALAAGANTVMIGSLLAGTRESPGIVVVRNGRRYKKTRGMASLGATMSRDASEGEPVTAKEYAKVVPEGVEASVPYRGPVEEILHQLVGGLRSGLSYAGARDLPELREAAEFVRLTAAGNRESGPHDVDEM